MKKSILKILVFCLVFLLFAGCDVFNSELNSDSANKSASNAKSIGNGIDELFDEFTTIDWNKTLEDIKNEQPDFAGSDNPNYAEFESNQVVSRVQYTIILNEKRFTKLYIKSEMGNRIYIMFRSVDKLSEEEMEQLNIELDKQLNLLNSEIRKSDNANDLIAKNEFGYIQSSLKDDSIYLTLYSSDSNAAQNLFSKAAQ